VSWLMACGRRMHVKTTAAAAATAGGDAKMMQ